MSINFFSSKPISLERFFVVVLILAIATVSVPSFTLAEEEILVDQPAASANDGEDGLVGIEGEEGESGGETIPVHSENELLASSTDDGNEGGDGLDSEPELENITGGQATSSPNDVIIETGDATAGGSLSTDVNSNEVQSLLATTSEPGDLDLYTLTATGTNDAILMNQGTTTAVTGENLASSSDNVFIETGDALSTLNIANVVNTNVINSSGYIYLLNELLIGEDSWELQDLFFPEGNSFVDGAGKCTLLSCAAEDVIYNIEHMNTATVTNDVNIDAISGRNIGEGDVVSITTGDSYGAANVINVVNTNIIDSNYRLLALNGIGTLDGDLVLPSEALFRAFFGMPNGYNQQEDSSDVSINDNNINTANVNNNLNTVAETGINQATTSIFATTKTGVGEANSNVINEVNKNLFGGDSLYMLIRVHGSWNGNVYGLPEGLTWSETDEGIVIYSADAEIVPSEILNYDHDSYTANFNNQNDVTIDNNLNINSVSGDNALVGNVGLIDTGNAYAGANVLNVANTNVVGRNWIMAIMNIFGNFNGNVSFGRPDLWIGGQVQATNDPVGPGTKLVYTYTISNNGDLKATEVELSHVFNTAHIRYSGSHGEELNAYDRREMLGTIQPGESRVVSFDAYVDDNLPYGTNVIDVEAVLALHESDSNLLNNREKLTMSALNPEPVASVSSSGGGGSSVSGGRGGGSKKSKGKVLGKSIELIKGKINPKSTPKLTVKKTADINEKKIVQAGEEVKYTVVVTNTGGTAYNAIVSDQLLNPIGAVVSELDWNIGTINAGEKITLDYTIAYDSNTPSGIYTNTANVVAYRYPDDSKRKIKVADAVHTLEIKGQSLAIGNVGVVMFVPMGNGQSAAIITWETIKPTDSQIFFGLDTGTSTPYTQTVFNYGYTNSSYRSPILTTRHYIMLTGLTNGATYDYRLRSLSSSTDEIVSKEYSFVVPENDPFMAWIQ